MSNWVKWAIAGVVALLMVGWLYNLHFAETPQEKRLRETADEIRKLNE